MHGFLFQVKAAKSSEGKQLLIFYGSKVVGLHPVVLSLIPLFQLLRPRRY
jgi:hypothetical protein